MTEALDGQVSLFDLGIWSGKTCPERSAATSRTDSEILEPCWKKLYASQNRDFLFLDCRTSRSGRKPEGSSATDGALLGEHTTPNTGACRSADGESAWWLTLTGIPQGTSSLNVSEKPNLLVYTQLSHILEEDPDPKYNLTAKACAGILRRAERRGKPLPEELKMVLIMQSASGGGCDGGGKGALVQTDKSGTLGCNNDQTIFCLQGNGIDRADTANCNGNGWKEDISYTINTIDRPAVCAGFKGGQGEKAGGIGYSEEVSPTLSAAPSGSNQVPLTISKVAGTLDANYYKGCGERGGAEREYVATFSQQGFGDYKESGIGSSCKQRDAKDATDLVISIDDEKNAYIDQFGTLKAHASGGTQQHVMERMVVRRLMPLECERLQGFEDGWTDIGEWTDSKGKKHKLADAPRYKALGNSIALPFWRWMFERMAAYLPEGATLGSLFDGLGGFPLCWERIHGTGTAKWASEIEEFPIAVTKHHFGGESDDR